MTVSLGGVALSDHLVLDGLEAAPLVGYSVDITLGGQAVVQTDEMDAAVGLELQLRGENHFTLAQLQAVRALRGQTVSLVHHRGTMDVVVLNTEIEPTIDYADPAGTDWYSGVITMITV